MTATAKLYLSIAAVVAAVVGFLAFRAHERQLGAQQVLLHVADSTHAVALAQAASALQAAQAAADRAAQAQATALAAVAAGKRLQARTDSAAQQAAAERDHAVQVLHDSAATAAQLQAEIGRLVASSRADSAAASRQHAADTLSIHGLLATIVAKDSALAAGDRALAGQKAVTAAVQKELDLTRSLMPSKLGKVLWGLAGAGGGYVIGRAH